MRISPYLGFKDQCEEAFKFYEQALGGKIHAMLAYGATPAAEHTPVSRHKKIMHACLVVGDNLLMGGDAPTEEFKKIEGCSVSIHVKEPAEAERVFQALSPGATILMPIGPTFWSKCFGMLNDQFGVPWIINCEAAPEGAEGWEENS